MSQNHPQQDVRSEEVSTEIYLRVLEIKQLAKANRIRLHWDPFEDFVIMKLKNHNPVSDLVVLFSSDLINTITNHEDSMIYRRLFTLLAVEYTLFIRSPATGANSYSNRANLGKSIHYGLVIITRQLCPTINSNRRRGIP